MKLHLFLDYCEWVLTRPEGGFASGRETAPSGFDLGRRLDTLRMNPSAMRRVRAFIASDLMRPRLADRDDRDILIWLAEAIQSGILILNQGEAYRPAGKMRSAPAPDSGADQEEWQEMELEAEPQTTSNDDKLIDETLAQALAASNREMHAEGQALKLHCTAGACEVCNAQQKVLTD